MGIGIFSSIIQSGLVSSEKLLRRPKTLQNIPHTTKINGSYSVLPLSAHLGFLDILLFVVLRQTTLLLFHMIQPKHRYLLPPPVKCKMLNMFSVAGCFVMLPEMFKPTQFWSPCALSTKFHFYFLSRDKRRLSEEQ